MKLVLSEAVASQHDAIQDLVDVAFQPYVRALGHDGEAADVYARISSALEDGGIFVCLDGEDVAAAIVTSRKAQDISIDYLAVEPARQGAGMGSLLLAELEAVARSAGANALVLHTAEIRHDLLRFYRRNGFVETRRAPPAHGKDTYLRIHMRKQL